LTQLESIYRAATVVANICVYAASDRNKPIAIIVPAEPALKKLAHENGIEGHGLEDLVHDKKLNGMVLNALQTAGKDGGLAGIEIIEAVVMADEEWTPQNVSILFPAVNRTRLTRSSGHDNRSTEGQQEGDPVKVSEGSRKGLCRRELRSFDLYVHPLATLVGWRICDLLLVYFSRPLITTAACNM